MKHFYLTVNKSPTHANLASSLIEEGWQKSKEANSSLVDDSWLHFPALVCDTLEYKHLLTAFLQTNQLTHLMPETYFINDRIWPEVLNRIEPFLSASTPWILKPSMLNNGQHIHIFTDLHSIRAHFSSSQRLGGPQVLQRYIIKPKLVKGPVAGHKFSIRQLVVLSTHAASGLYPDGYLNISLKPYNHNNFDQLSAHLTNEHLDHERINVVQRVSKEMLIYQSSKEKISSICRLLVTALKEQYASLWEESPPRLAFFGFDFMVEASNDRVWLLEVNHGPCFPTDESHPLFKTLYRPFWQQVIKQFIERQPSTFLALDK